MDLIPGLGRSPGGGPGNPLQYSCLENSLNRGAWWLTVHRSQRVRYEWTDLACTYGPNPSTTKQARLEFPEWSLDTEKIRLKHNLFLLLGQSLLRIECKVDVIDWSVYIGEAQVELTGIVIKAFRLTVVWVRGEGVNGSGCGPGAVSLLSASPLTLETELWEWEAPAGPHSSPDSWKHPTVRC